MDYDKNMEFLLEIKRNLLEPEDSFEFGCKSCGECCRNRAKSNNQILITAVDLFNIAKELDMSTEDAMMKFTECLPGPDSKLPLLYLTERLDGSCRLLRKGKCMVHKSKPVVCRVYPLGRGSTGKEFFYFKQDGCKGDGQTVKLKDYIEQFNLTALDDACMLWSKLTIAATLYMQKLGGKSQTVKEFYEDCFYSFYVGYDMEKSVEDNLTERIAYLESKYHKFKVAL